MEVRGECSVATYRERSCVARWLRDRSSVVRWRSERRLLGDTEFMRGGDAFLPVLFLP